MRRSRKPPKPEEPRPAGPEERLREGWPRALPLVLLFLLPALVAGPIRAITGLNAYLSLIFGIPIAWVAALPFWRALTRKSDDRRRAALANGVPLALMAASLYLLYNRDFAGLYGYQDAGGNVAIDAAVHVLTAHNFNQLNPGEYQGFVSLYSFWFAICHFVDMVTAANAAYFLQVFVVVAAPCLVAFAVLRGQKGRALYAGAAACLVAGVLVDYLVIWPLEAFHFGGGFWAHLFALVPLCAIWWADAFIRPQLLRISAILALVLLYRYTYGLNLADLLAAVGGVIALEAAARGTRARRIGAGVLALAIFAAAEYAFTLLGPRMTGQTGWIVPHDMAAAWKGQLVGVAALAATIVFGRGEKAGIFRALRFPALFGLANAVLVERFKALPGGEHAYVTMWANYYFHKYSLHAVILVAAGCVTAAAFWAAALAAKPRWQAAAGAALALVLGAAAVEKMGTAFAPYQEVLHEVAFTHAPYPHLRPWADTTALQQIRSTLRSEGREHGGYLAQYYPLAAFMNATFGHGHAPFWERQPVETTPGHCVFVADGEQLDHCTNYPAAWEGSERKLCWKCF
jgi:hypothetical protein